MISNQDKINLKNLSFQEMEKLAVDLGKKPFTGRQLYKWVFQQGIDNFDLMTDLSKDFRKFLAEKCKINKLKEAKQSRSSDGTTKTLWQTVDGLFIESVLIPDDDRLTLCLSSQAGCPLGCSFCATGKMGFSRNLNSGEIYDQFLLSKHKLPEGKKITNIVFMGMGEPFLNYDNLLRACDTLTNQLGGDYASRRITVSTAGLISSIYKLAEDNPRLKLAISLHSANDAKREKLIPIASKNPLQKLKQAAIHFAKVSDNRVTFEYLIIDKINDGIEDAKELANFVRGIPCKINLIIYNPVDGIPFNRPNNRAVESFREFLLPRTSAVMVRKSKGVDIAAACGQLAGKQIKTNH